MAFRTKRDGLTRCTGYFYEGREITLSKAPGEPIKKSYHSAKWWPDTKKIEAATLYVVLRDFKKVSQLTGIPHKTIELWVVEPWWSEVISRTIKLKNEELDGKITEALDKGLDIVLDRLENGEIFVDRKTGEHRRVPMSTKNTTLGIDILFDKRQLLRGEATTRSETITQEQRLIALKDQFEKLAKSKGINIKSEPIEGEITNELLDEQKPGPEERASGEVSGSAGSPEVEDGGSVRTGTGTA